MSVHAAQNGSSGHPRPVTVHDIRAPRSAARSSPCSPPTTTCRRQILEEAGIPLLLVGDSLGMVMLGYDSTVPVSDGRDAAPHPCRLAWRAERLRGRRHAVRLLPGGPDAGARATPRASSRRPARTRSSSRAAAAWSSDVEQLVAAGIPVMAHLGLTPAVASTPSAATASRAAPTRPSRRCCADALALEAAGAFSLVLEAVPADVGSRVTQALRIPTIGIGAGADTDGQVLVWHDMLGPDRGPPAPVRQAYAEPAGRDRGGRQDVHPRGRATASTPPRSTATDQSPGPPALRAGGRCGAVRGRAGGAAERGQSRIRA